MTAATAVISYRFGLSARPIYQLSYTINSAGRTAIPGLALFDVPRNRAPRFHRLGRNSNLPT